MRSKNTPMQGFILVPRGRDPSGLRRLRQESRRTRRIADSADQKDRGLWGREWQGLA